MCATNSRRGSPICAQALEVQGGDDGLAGAGGGDHEVLEAVVAFAFGGKLFENLGLMRLGRDV